MFRLSLIASALCAFPTSAFAALVWNAEIRFDDFAGLPGGFESGPAVFRSPTNPSPSERSYDILRATGVDPATGATLYANGQDGTPDLHIAAQVYDWSGGRWTDVSAGRTGDELRAGITVMPGTSRTDDRGLVVMEIRLASGITISPDQLIASLTSANGTSEAYEWTMITTGLASEAPFTPSQIGTYRATDYHDMASSAYYSASGVPTGLAGTGLRLDRGRSMSQFLSGRGGGSPSGGLVAPGWYAIDDFNATFLDGPEDIVTNPFPGDGFFDDNVELTGPMLGLGPTDEVSALTFWFGYNDIAFDSNGNGFTTTDTNIYELLGSLSLGYQSATAVPEPASALAAIALMGFGLRRSRACR
jgi:hypothetical protein